jgi:hypothetical protein
VVSSPKTWISSGVVGGGGHHIRAVVMSSPKRECLPDRKPLIP